MKAGILYAVCFYGCNKIDYKGKDLLFILKEGARRVGATITGETSYDFYPQGTSAVLMLAESHYAIHTFPEKKKAVACFHTCGNIDSWEAIKVVAHLLEAEKIISKKIDFDGYYFTLPET